MGHSFWWYIGVVLFIYFTPCFLFLFLTEYSFERECDKNQGKSFLYTIGKLVVQFVCSLPVMILGSPIILLTYLGLILSIPKAIKQLPFYAKKTTRDIRLWAEEFKNKMAIIKLLDEAINKMNGCRLNRNLLLVNTALVKRVVALIMTEEITFELTLNPDLAPFNRFFVKKWDKTKKQYYSVPIVMQENFLTGQKVGVRLAYKPGLNTHQQNIDDLHKHGLKPANPIHLLALSLQYPRLLELFDIISYGYWEINADGKREFLLLSSDELGRAEICMIEDPGSNVAYLTSTRVIALPK